MRFTKLLGITTCMTEAVLTSIVSAASGLVGAAIGLCGALAISRRAARLDERKHFRELGLKIGLTNFEHCTQLAQAAANRYQRFFEVPPLKVFVIQGIKLMEIVSDDTLSADEMARRISESEDFTQSIRQATKEKYDRDA